MIYKDSIIITPRFQRAIRIDADLTSAQAMSGFICPQSSADALLNMARHISETGQSAFTWTGPYGSGKSSLVIALASLLNGNDSSRNEAITSIGEAAATDILETLPPQSKGWRFLPVVGRREDPVRVIEETLRASNLSDIKKKGPLSESELIEELLVAAKNKPKSHGGLILFIDEMGKFLEGAAQHGTDIYFFQQLAEAASRSNKRLIVVGILHQAFEDYAHRLSRGMRDEWSKIQGRFIDLPINVAGEEQLDLLSRAIQSDHKASITSSATKKITQIVQNNKRGISDNFAILIEGCWPLHPAVACLLGPISRRRFGQNQRSLFGFLNSAEPHAFQDFIKHATEGDLYQIEDLWEYLRTNLEPSILASPDGHKWSLAIEAIERCEAHINSDLHLRLLKIISLVDLFKGNSGLVPSLDFLHTSTTKASKNHIKEALEDLKKWSYIIYRKHLKAYAIYAGSDFDIDEAVTQALEEIREVDFSRLKQLAGLQPIMAKRHYHSTGTLRWFDVDLVPLNSIVEKAKEFIPAEGTIGQFLLAISTENEDEKSSTEWCKEAANLELGWDLVVGLSNQSWTISDLAKEIIALEKIHTDNTELSGDSVARREIRARLIDLQNRLEIEFNRAFDKAIWFHNQKVPKELSKTKLSILASELADKQFHQTPNIQNELLNRIKPSSSAIGAQNVLLRCMVENEGKPRLGIQGFPAEGGLFATILENSGLYDNAISAYVSPKDNTNDSCNLKPIWKVASEFLSSNSDRAVSISEIYDIWRKAPYGVRNGLMPILAIAFILSEKKVLAFYRDGIFQSRLRDLDVEILAKDPSSIQIRHMDLSEVLKNLLSGMAETVRELDEMNSLEHLEPIDVARGLISIYDGIHPWSQKTMHLSKEAIRIRNLFKKANDPNKFLFDDIPGLLGSKIDLNSKESNTKIIQFIHEGLKELKNAYPTEINRFREIMLTELQVPNSSPQAMSELRGRAENIKDISGDFRLEAFVVRLSKFTGSDEDIESVASLATNKPPRNWLDNDIDRAKVEITALAQKFIRTESFARVKGRDDKRHALSIVVGINGRPTPLDTDFVVADTDREDIDKVVKQLRDIIHSNEKNNKDIVLAALTELCAQYIQDTKESDADSKLEKAVS